MAGTVRPDAPAIQQQLQAAVIACNDRCLYHSAKWAAELHHSVSESLANASNHDLHDVDETMDSSPPLDNEEIRLQRAETSRYLLAKSFFDCREFDRCAVTLMPSLLPTQPIDRKTAADILSSPPVKDKGKSTRPLAGATRHALPASHTRLSRRSMFLALYAKYMAGEKRKEEDSEMVLGPADGPVTPNTELPKILAILEQYFAERGGLDGTARSDGFLEYLYGIALNKSKSDEYAKQWLLKSVRLYQWNWGAWQELTSCINSVHELNRVTSELNDDLGSSLFRIYSTQELAQPDEQIQDTLDEMDATFPNSAFLQTQRAVLMYHLKGKPHYQEAQGIFSSITKKHPYRLDSLDKYSDILFVDKKRPQLAYLASVASATDKFRPETCCIIGNYYCLIEKNEEAIMYFRRALTLDRTYSFAWILMGHAYLELRSGRAAIESYRRALDANKNDYRAWHGLGYAYESLDMQSYALYYYQRAAALQPLDHQMWMAVGAAFKRCGKLDNAIRAYKRALGATGPLERSDPSKHLLAASERRSGPGGGPDPLAGAVGGAYNEVILYRIAELYEEAGDDDEAAAYMELCMAQEEGPDESDLPLGVQPGSVPSGIGVTQHTKAARLWLARFCFARQDWQRATDLANELCQDGYEVEEAKALKKDVRARMEADELSRSIVA